jgi:hypothetical protein
MTQREALKPRLTLGPGNPIGPRKPTDSAQAHSPKYKNPPLVSQRRVLRIDHREERKSVLGRPGSDLLFQALRLSTIGAEGFNGRVRYGNGFRPLARTTRPAKNRFASWLSFIVTPFRCSSFETRRSRGAPEDEVIQWAWEMRTIKIERAIRTGKLNASFVSALTHPAYQRDGLSRLLREFSFRGGFLA